MRSIAVKYVRQTVVLMVAALVACSTPDRRQPAAAVPAAEGMQPEHAGAEAVGRGAAAGEEASDLDRPTEELFVATCQHGKKTHACDECRAEVGVARAPASLFEGGLLAAVKVERRRVEVPLRLTGEVQFDERRVAHVSSQVGGVVRVVHATLGDRVERGQVLVEVESTDVAEARVSDFEVQGRLRLARATLTRLETLRSENIASEREYLDARRELESAEISAAGTRARLGYLGIAGRRAGAASASIARGLVTLRAPLSGTVLQMHAVSGEFAEVGESLLTVGDNTTLWVWADLYERDLARVLAAQPENRLAASVSVEAYGDEEFLGSVDFLSPTMDETSRTAKLRIAVPNPGGRLLAGMFATVKVFFPTEELALAVPTEAVLEDEGRSFVFVRHNEDYYVRRPVEVGRAFAGWVEVTAGPAEGETVVGRGAFLLKSDVLRSKMGAGCAD